MKEIYSKHFLTEFIGPAKGRGVSPLGNKKKNDLNPLNRGCNDRWILKESDPINCVYVKK